jgi:hypothetical protein
MIKEHRRIELKRFQRQTVNEKFNALPRRKLQAAAPHPPSADMHPAKINQALDRAAPDAFENATQKQIQANACVIAGHDITVGTGSRYWLAHNSKNHMKNWKIFTDMA